MERQVQRTKRQVDLQSRPQVLDYSYSPSLPPSTANLSVYERWNAGRPIGLGRHHTVSASWDGEDRGRTNNEHIGQRGQGMSEVLTNRLIRGPSSHRHSRVASSDSWTQQGVLVELPGQDARSSQLPHSLPSPPPSHLPQSVPTHAPMTPPLSTPPPSTRTSRSYSRPDLRSLGTPDLPTGPSTAVQLEAGEPATLRNDGRHTHWKYARWARRLGAAASFPLSDAGEVGVPSPGLYLVYAQVTYTHKSLLAGFSLEINGRPKLFCQERRGTRMQISCYTGGLLYLEQGDKVSVSDIKPESGVNTEHGKSFFGIVKLTGDWI